MSVLNPTIEHSEDLQLVVTIVEARQLSGININPYFELRCGEETKVTETQIGTNQPYYNAACSF